MTPYYKIVNNVVVANVISLEDAGIVNYDASISYGDNYVVFLAQPNVVIDMNSANIGALQQYYSDVAKGVVKITPKTFGTLLSTYNGGIGKEEFDYLPPEVKIAAIADPQLFIASALANKNPANGDMLSFGAEGGYSDFSTMKWNGAGLEFDKAKYMQIRNGGIGPVLTFAALIAAAYFIGPMIAGQFGGVEASTAAVVETGAVSAPAEIAGVSITENAIGSGLVLQAPVGTQTIGFGEALGNGLAIPNTVAETVGYSVGDLGAGIAVPASGGVGSGLTFAGAGIFSGVAATQYVAPSLLESLVKKLPTPSQAIDGAKYAKTGVGLLSALTSAHRNPTIPNNRLVSDYSPSMENSMSFSGWLPLVLSAGVTYLLIG